MTKTEVNKFKAILEAKKRELEGNVRNREGIVIEKATDPLDQVQYSGERELAIRNLDRESNQLKNVCAALRRMTEGSFGVCMQCEEDINIKRLNAVPWTPYCISCQQNADLRSEEFSEEFSELEIK